MANRIVDGAAPVGLVVAKWPTAFRPPNAAPIWAVSVEPTRSRNGRSVGYFMASVIGSACNGKQRPADRMSPSLVGARSSSYMAASGISMNPCPLLLIGLPSTIVTFNEGLAALAEVEAAEEEAPGDAA